MNTEKYAKEYSDSKLEGKLAKFAKRAGKGLVLNVLKLYYAMKLGKVNAKQIAIILGALGYFIAPIDVIPDFIPGAGFIDDMAILVAAIKVISACSDPEVVRAAETRVSKLFG